MYFRRMKYAYVIALSVAITALVTSDTANPAGDALVGVLALSVFVMMRGEAKQRYTEFRLRYYRNRYKEEVSARMARDYPEPARVPHNLHSICDVPNCVNAAPHMHNRAELNSISRMSVDDIERSQGA